MHATVRLLVQGIFCHQPSECPYWASGKQARECSHPWVPNFSKLYQQPGGVLAIRHVRCFKFSYSWPSWFSFVALGFIFFGILSGRQHLCTQYWKLGSQSMCTFTSTGRGAQTSQGSKLAVFVSNGDEYFAFHFFHPTLPLLYAHDGF